MTRTDREQQDLPGGKTIATEGGKRAFPVAGGLLHRLFPKPFQKVWKAVGL